MNFDDLKKAWDQEEEGKDLKEVQLSVDHANNAIDKVRANMRLDFYGILVMGILAIVGLSYVGLKVDIQPIVFFAIASFAFLFFSLMLFFCFKFYKFYKHSYNLSYDSRENLMWFYYELRNFIEFYHTFYFVVFVMSLAFGLAVGLMTATLEEDQGRKDAIGRALTFGFTGKVIYFGSIGTLVIGGTFLFRWMIQKMYGRYLNQIKQTLDLLKPEE